MSNIFKTDFRLRTSPKVFASYDVLGFWKSKENQFPVLSALALDILSVQASSVASESSFSNNGRLLTIRKEQDYSESIEMLHRPLNLTIKKLALDALVASALSLQEKQRRDYMDEQRSRR
ncbi:zinc finger BED domain-containing protein RICESLEEPER 2 [Tanacetum coccineum]